MRGKPKQPAPTTGVEGLATRIIWLTPKYGISDGMKALLAKYIRSVGLNMADVFFVNVHQKVKDGYIHRGKGEVPNATAYQSIAAEILAACTAFSAKIIIANDAACLSAISGSALTLYRGRGMVYNFAGRSCIGVDDIKLIHHDKTFSMKLISDLRKVVRYVNNNQYEEPKFRYTVCRTPAQLQEAKDWLLASDVISCDIETANQLISCVGFCGVRGREIRSFVIPFLCYAMAQNAFWPTDAEEMHAWAVVRVVLGSDIPKVFQNGSYDCSYFIRYRIVVVNYLYDTLHLYHSIWCELEKKLNISASLLVDAVRFWKDDKKADEQDRYKQTPAWWEQFWRYNAYDCWITMVLFRRLLVIAASQSWVRTNYWKEFKLQIGPALAGSLRGLKCNQRRRIAKVKFLQSKANQALAALRVITDEPNFNPGSSDQVCQLVYGVFGAPEKRQRTRGGVQTSRTADQVYLKEVATRHPIFKRIIEALWAVKKPLNDVSKYGTRKLLSWGDRFRFGLNAAATETGRFGSSKSAFWTGTNAQNIKPAIRELFVADPGFVLFEPDFSQSDAWFVAHEANEADFIRNLNSGKDTHCVHAAHFFKYTYEKVLDGYASGDPFFADSATGIRTVTKRVVHGANYRMMALTLYRTMGREAVMAAALALGATNVYELSDQDLIDVCGKLLEEYHIMYPGLRPWFGAIVQECVANGGLATCFGGRTRLFLGNIQSDEGIQRELSAYYGQGGTAGNVNRVLEEVYWQHMDWEANGECFFLSQTHDSMLYMIRANRMHYYAKEILNLMQQPITVKGHTFSVPVDAKIGLSWGGTGLVKYKPDITLEYLQERDKVTQERYDRLFESVMDEQFDNKFLEKMDLESREVAVDAEEEDVVAEAVE